MHDTVEPRNRFAALETDRGGEGAQKGQIPPCPSLGPREGGEGSICLPIEVEEGGETEEVEAPPNDGCGAGGESLREDGRLTFAEGEENPRKIVMRDLGEGGGGHHRFRARARAGKIVESELSEVLLPEQEDVGLRVEGLVGAGQAGLRVCETAFGGIGAQRPEEPILR